MAKQSSIIKIEGTIDDFTFYKSKDGYRVRKKSGVSADRIQNDPAYARTRENGLEFGQIATTGKYFRRGVLKLSKRVSDVTLIPRLVKQFSRIKNLDALSKRGDRTVAIGLETPEGKKLLTGFDFNVDAPLQAVVRSEIELDTATGIIRMQDFDPSAELGYPPGATHVHFQAGFLNLDFETGLAELEVSPEVEVSLDAEISGVQLSPAAVPAGEGHPVFLMLAAFYQEINGVQYPMNNGAFNALSVLEVL